MFRHFSCSKWILLYILVINSIFNLGLTTCPPSYSSQMTAVTVSSYTLLDCAITAQIPTIYVNSSFSFPDQIHVPPGSSLQILASPVYSGIVSLAVSSLSQSRLFNISGQSTVKFSSLRFVGTSKHVNAADVSLSDSNVGGLLYISEASVTIFNSTLVNGLAICGSAIYAENQATLKMDASHILNNTDNSLGQCNGAIVVDQSNITISETLFQGNDAFAGGALYLNKAHANIFGSTFKANIASTTDGGGIWATSCTLNVENCIFQSNSAGGNGGAILVQDDVNVTIHTTTFQNNFALEKGGTIFASNSDIYTSQIKIMNSAAISGGAFFINGGALMTSNSSFIGNVAGAGAAIMCSMANIDVHNSKFTDNTASTSGGAIAAQAKCQVNVTHTLMHRNSAIKSESPIAIGGGISCQQSTVMMTNTVISDGKAIQGAGIFASQCNIELSRLELYNLVADFSAIYTIESRMTLTLSQVSNSSAVVSTSAVTCFADSHCVITDSIFSNNVAQEIGAVQVFNSPSSIERCVFNNNSARGDGGAMSIFNSPQTVIQNCSFTGNIANNAGGAVSIEQRSHVQILSSTFFGNNAVYGGALQSFDECSVLVSNVSFLSNSGLESGGSIYLSDYATLNGNNLRIINSRSPYGGGIYIGYASSATINYLTANGNVAPYAGGAIAAFDEATVTLTNSDLSNNQAALGGAMAGQYKSIINLQATQIYKNTVDAYGGAIYLLVDSLMTVNSCQFSENDGKYGGGAAYVEASILQIENSSFVDHSANTGAVCFMVNSQAVVEQSTFTSNGDATFNGGVIFLSSLSQMTSTSNEFKSNQALYGGSIALEQSRFASVSDKFVDCIAKTGGCIYSTINSTVHISGDSFTKNRGYIASTGVVYISTGSLWMKDSVMSYNLVKTQGSMTLFSVDTTIINSTFFQNTADSTTPDGGAIYIACITPCVSDSTLSTAIINSSFTGNSATNGLGGAIYANSYPGTVTVSSSRFVSNLALNGGAIAVKYTSVLVEDATFKANTAYEGGGAVFWFYNKADPTVFVGCRDAGDNTASYGDFHATDLVSLNSTFSIAEKQVSGYQLTVPINVTLLDYYGQIMTNSSLYDGASTTIYCSVNEDSGVIKGKSIVPSVQGVATFSELIITGVPGGVTSLRFSVPISVIADRLQNVAFRQCISGEITVNVGQGLSSCQKCGFGTYSFFPTDTACTACPSHASCPGGNVLDLDKNYWRVYQNSATILPCPVPDVCLGGTNTSTQCRTGQTGPYCTVCDEGYTKSSSGDCYSCSDPTGTMMEVLSTMLFIIFVGILYGLYKYRKYLVEVYAKSMNATVKNRKFKSLNVKAKIVVSFVQIIFQLGPAFNIVFPIVFLRYLNYYSIFQLNLLVLPNMNCLFTANYYDALIATTLSPPMIFVFLAIVFQIRVLVAKRLNEKRPSYTAKDAKQDTITFAFLISYFVLVNVSTKIFQVFQCETFDNGSSYLVADYSINCGASDRTFYVTYGVLMIFIYPIGIPLIYALILLRNRTKINPDWRKVIDAEEKSVVSNRVIQKEKIKVRSTYDEIKNIKNLYESYVPKRWYFELFDCARRLCLGAIPVLIFRGSTLQIIVVLLVSLFSVAAFMYLQPYIHTQDNHLAIIAQWSITLVVISAMIIKVEAIEGTTRNSEGLGAVLIFLNVSVIAFSFGAAILDSKTTDDDDPDGFLTDLGLMEEKEEGSSSEEEDGDEESKEDSSEKKRKKKEEREKKEREKENKRKKDDDMLSSGEDDDERSIDSDDEMPLAPSSSTPKSRPTSRAISHNGENGDNEEKGPSAPTRRKNFIFGGMRPVSSNHNAKKPVYEVEMNNIIGPSYQLPAKRESVLQTNDNSHEDDGRMSENPLRQSNVEKFQLEDFATRRPSHNVNNGGGENTQSLHRRVSAGPFQPSARLSELPDSDDEE